MYPLLTSDQSMMYAMHNGVLVWIESTLQLMIAMCLVYRYSRVNRYPRTNEKYSIITIGDVVFAFIIAFNSIPINLGLF